MLQAEFIVAFSIGFFGSLHCVGMCGPIALVSPSLFPGTFGRFLSSLIYNSGRTITYMILGAAAGMLGRGIAFFHWQQAISLLLGVLIICSVLLPKVFKNNRLFSNEFHLTNWLKNQLVRVLKTRSIVGILSIGLINGLLPCGLVYLGLAGSIDSSNAYNGALFMLFFGFGTFPMMTGVHLIGNNLSGTVKNKLSKALPYFIVGMGLLFILRGAGLGIPYLSPSMEAHDGDTNCHIPSHRH